jgi:hypothetical protein
MSRGYLMLNPNRTPSMPTPNIQAGRNEYRKILAIDSIEMGDAMVIRDLYHLPDREGCVEMLICFDLIRRVSRQHGMLEIPASPLAQSSHNSITVTEQIDVEVDMVNRLDVSAG